MSRRHHRTRCRDCAERMRRGEEPSSPAEIPMQARAHLADACQMMAQGQLLYARELVCCGLALLDEARVTSACGDLRGQLLAFLQVIERGQMRREA